MIDQAKLKILEEQEFLALAAAMDSRVAAYELIEGIKEDEFYCTDARRIFKKFLKLHEEMADINLGNVKRSITAERDLETIEKIRSFTDANPEEMSAYIGFIKEEAKKRLLHEIGNQLRKEAHDDESTSDGLINRLMQSILDIELAKNRRSFVTPGEFLEGYLDEIKNISEGKLSGYSTSIPALDRILGGYQKGTLTVIAARPGMCKSAFAIQSATHLALTYGFHVPFFSLEMTQQQLGLRIVASLARVPHYKIRLNRGLTSRDWKEIAQAMELIKQMPLYLDDTSGISLAEIISKTKRFKIKKGDIGPIFIDYLNKMSMSGGGTRDQDVTKTVSGIKDLAKDLDVPAILLAQLNRKVEERDDKRPQLSDLRESGSIEQEADVVIFPYRGSYYTKDELTKNDIEINIAKHRHGELGTIKANVNLDYQIISSSSQEEEFEHAI